MLPTAELSQVWLEIVRPLCPAVGKEVWCDARGYTSRTEHDGYTGSRHRVLQPADAGDVDGDVVAGQEGEVVGGHDAGAG